MDDFDDLKITDSEDDENAEQRVRMIMEEIYKNQDKIKSEKDIEEMAERCTNMMTQMRTEAYQKKKDKKQHRASGSGDKASPPPSRASVKESPRRDSTKAAPSPRLPTTAKPSLKEQNDPKKKIRSNLAEMYKDKMDKLRVPSRAAQTKTDSVKPSKPKVELGTRRKIEKVPEESISESESESSSATTASQSGASEDYPKALDTRQIYEKMMKDMNGREMFKGKAAEAHKKASDWMSSTRSEQVKKKEMAGSSKAGLTKQEPKIPFYSSSDLDSEDEKLAQELKSKMTMASKKPQQDKDTLKKLMASMEKPLKSPMPVTKTAATPLRKATTQPGPKIAISRAAPTAEKPKPRKKI